MLSAEQLEEMVKAAARERAERKAEYERFKIPNPENKMSPYRPHTSKPLNTVSDWINNYQFKAWYTQNYTPIAREYLEGEIKPIYIPCRGDEKAFGVLTIAGMLDLLDMGESFTLADAKDLPRIKTICTDYLDQIPNVELSAPDEAIIARIKNLVSLIEKSMDTSTHVVNIHSLLRRLVR